MFVGLRGSAPTLLQQGRSCDDVLDDFQAFAPDVMRDSFGIGRDRAFSETGQAAGGDDAAGADASAAAPAPAAEELQASTDGDTSETNTQEAGIDEPDVVETDGDFVYLVDEDRLVILDGATAGVVSRTQLAGHGAQIMLSGDRLLAITGGYGYGGPIGIATDDVAIEATTEIAESAPPSEGQVEPTPAEPPVLRPSEPDPQPEPEPGPLPVEPPEFQSGTVMQLIDVADRAAPVTVQTTELEGQHVSTRVVDGVARVVISTYPQQIFENQIFESGAFQDPDGFDENAVEAALTDSIDATTIDDWLPAFRTSSGTTVEAEGPIVACEDVLVPEVNAGLAETSILRVDFTDGFDPADTTTVVAEAGTVYASTSTLYIAATRYVSGPAQLDVSAEDWSTAIHAFDLRSDGAAPHVGAGEVPGSTLNQYSLSEFDGYLRIATTEGTPWRGNEDSESAVRVLHLEGDELVEVGIVGGLGVTETIQSVRFMGPVGYVVTFRQTDPLYVIDLSDPEAPAAVGELKIPGFSSYLHPAGEGRLIGVGRDADLDGRDRGLLVSLFDVSDPTAPTQLQTYTEQNAYSAAGNDPKAFLWWAPESAVVLPVERYGPPTALPEFEGDLPGGDVLDGDVAVDSEPFVEPDFSVGMTVLSVDDAGITERATITADGRYASRALVVGGVLWSLFDGGVVTSGFDGSGGTFHPLR